MKKYYIEFAGLGIYPYPQQKFRKIVGELTRQKGNKNVLQNMIITPEAETLKLKVDLQAPV